MVSLTNKNDGELGTKPESVEEPSEDAKSRISKERFTDSTVIDEARVSEMDLDSGSPGSSEGHRVSEEAKVKTEVSKESDGGEMEAKEAEVKVESSSADGEDEDGQTGKNNGSQFNSLLSEFYDFVANENSGQMAASRALRYGFHVGDLVWGKVKSHPWWPGHIFNEAFATPQVRRTRRVGHVLVAFFGDSSYGWFDPADFIPFDANFAEKSKQTSSRNFTKALEEAVDEASRRCGLGLACKCRSPYSFRAANVKGYFSVDVPDYEPHAIYSAKQIQTARDRFRPREALAFVKNLALSPCIGNDKNLEFVKNKATINAYRKAVFEEFDVTYAQAFGVQPGREVHDRPDSQNQSKQPPRAPLSGPLVIAETLGGGKSATKEKKVKDSSQKDKYLLKRRDESSNLKKGSHGKESSAVPLASSEGSVAVGDKAFQKPEIVNKKDADSDSNGSEAVTINQGLTSRSNVAQDVSIDSKSSLDKGKSALSEVYEGSGSVSGCIPVSKGTERSELLGDMTLKTDGASQSSKHEAHASVELMSTDREDGNHGMETVEDNQSVEGQSSSGAKSSSGHSKVSGVKKAKLKRSREESDAENPVGEGKKKKKKKQLDTETISAKPQKHSVPKTVGLSAGNKVGKTARPSLTPKKELKMKQSKKIASSSSLSDSSGTLQSSDLGITKLELPQLLSDLQLLALDPFHGKERSSPAIVRKFFLQFRSLVYQKSLSQSPPPESEALEARPSKSPASVGTSDNSSAEPIRELQSTKPAKPTFRSEDPTIAGRKRSSSDRQEDIAAKRSKKVNDIKTLEAEKKMTQKTPEAYRGSGEGREAAVPLGRRTKLDSSKRSEPSMLVMKFPPKTSLPSPAELKARFARFGPIDQSGLRVFWKSLTCRIVFLHRSDAQAACRYAAANTTLFGPPGMRCFVKEYGSSAEAGNDDNNTTEEAPRSRDSDLIRPAVQLKSCLKKPPADEPANRGTPRVKFMLGGDEATTTRAAEPSSSLAANRNNKNSGVPPSTSSSVEMDFTLVRNAQKVVPPILPLPLQFMKLNNNSHIHHHDVVAMGLRNSLNSGASVDISQQMLSLLTRCNDLVTSVTGFLGYVPYHPL